jgi:hypothetical protein
MADKHPPRPAPEKRGPQHQVTEEHGSVQQHQLDRHNAEHTKRGSEGDRRRASNMQR